MIDITTVLLVLAAALGYRFVSDYSKQKAPNVTPGVEESRKAPEMILFPQREIADFNANVFTYKGSSKTQEGTFAVDQ